MNRTQMIKRAYVRGLAARGIYRARLRQKQAAGGLKDYAISGGIGAAGGGALGSLIGALVQYARGKNILHGALAGGGIGGGLGLLGGLGYQYAQPEKPSTGSIMKEVIQTAFDPLRRQTFIEGFTGKEQSDPFNTSDYEAGKKYREFGDNVVQTGKQIHQNNINGLKELGNRVLAPVKDTWNRFLSDQQQEIAAKEEAKAWDELTNNFYSKANEDLDSLKEQNKAKPKPNPWDSMTLSQEDLDDITDLDEQEAQQRSEPLQITVPKPLQQIFKRDARNAKYDKNTRKRIK